MATKSDHSERKDLARQVLKEREEKKAASGSSSSNQG